MNGSNHLGTEWFVTHGGFELLLIMRQVGQLWDALSLFSFPYLSRGDQSAYSLVMSEIMHVHKTVNRGKTKNSGYSAHTDNQETRPTLDLQTQ